MKSLENDDAELRGSALEEAVEIMKHMIEKTRLRTAQASVYFILFGWLTLVACTATYVWDYLDVEHLIGWTWLVLMSSGAIVSIVQGIRRRKRAKVVSYIDQFLSNLWFACGLSIFLVAFVATALGAISINSMVPVLAVILGIGIFVTGGTIDWRLVRFAGVVWWFSALIMMLTPQPYHTLILALTIVPGELIPGYALRRRFLER